jgi:hypothetical protein
VLHLSFDKVGGTIVTNDGSGGLAMNGTLNGTATIVGGGKFGNCLQVAGAAASDASVRIASAVIPLNVGSGQPSWSVAMWFQTTTPGGCFAYQGSGGWAGGNTDFYLTGGGNGGRGAGNHAGAVRNGQEWEEGTTDVNDGLWHHFVLTFDGTTKVMYLDGSVNPFDENSWPGNGTGNQFWIGGNPYDGDGSVCLNGLIDEAYVFDQALNLSDVSGLFSSNALPIFPVAVTVNPTSGYRGAVFTVTATGTPAVGTVTNASGNLSALNLSSNLNLVQSSANVFTNSFTVPTNGPVGADIVKVTMTSDEPLVGSGGATFTVIPRPPTNAIILTQLSDVTSYQYTEASFFFGTTNDAPNDSPFPMTYSWYTNSVLVSTNPMGPHYTFLTTPLDNGMQVQAIARVADTNFSSLSVTSRVATLTVNPGSITYTNGLKEEFFAGGTRLGAEIGNVGPGVVRLVTVADSPGGFGDNHARRYSGYFIPPANDGYVFFVASDDDCDVFLSTDSNPVNKQLIAQEVGFSAPRNWQTIGGNGSTAGQKRSDQWSPDGGTTVPYSGGIQLVAGQKYYLEAVMHNGAGGDNWALTYQTTNELALDPSAPLDGTASRMTAASNNIAVVTWPGTTLSWVADLTPTNVTILEGSTTNFTALATSDAEMAVAYQWYIAGVPYPGETGTNFSLSSIPVSYNNAQIYVVAQIPEGSLVITSRVAILHVTQAVHEPGYIFDERWDGKIVNDIVTGNLFFPPSFQMAIVEWGISQDNAGGHNNFARRVSGYFKPPTTGLYNFYVTSDDDSILFLSTDDTPGHKRQIASQGGWNSGGNWQWVTANGGGVASQTHSDTWSPNGGATVPFAAGIMLTQGQRYYIEQDMHQGGGGANLAATYTAFGDPIPAVGTETVLKGSTIEMNVPRCGFVAFTQQPQNVANAALGSLVAFTAAGTTDSKVNVGGPFGYEETFTNSFLLFQWFTNGVPVPGATSSKFLMGPVTADMVGVPVMCQTRALGFSDDALNPIWTNSTSASILNTVAAAGHSLRGHWISGAASLADTANVVGPGVYDALTNRVTTSTRFLYFTNDVPPRATVGAQSLYFNANGLIITNTGSADPGYVVDTFDGGLQSGFTVMCWAKGFPNTWNPWVSKAGDNGTGWQLRINTSGPDSCWTMRGTGNTDDLTSSVGSNDGKWHHYTGTWDGTNLIRNLYVDGALTATATGFTTYTLGAASHLMIGARDAGGASFGSYYTGTIYDVRIYNYPLSQVEVVIVSGVPPPITSQVVAGQLVITWPVGTLLQATNVLGPWTTYSTVSPVTIDMTEPQQFFRVSNP